MSESSEAIKTYLESNLNARIPAPVRARLAFWMHDIGTTGETSRGVFVHRTVEYLNSNGPLDVGQAIAFVESQQASELILKRAIFLADSAHNPYASPAPVRN